MANEEAAPKELATTCRRHYAAIEKLDAKAAAMVGVSRNDLRCFNLAAEAPKSPAKSDQS